MYSEPLNLNLTIIIPVYNEADVIITTLKRIDNIAMPAFVRHTEVIIVDDCSGDCSAQLAESYNPVHFEKKLLRLPVNSGKGAAIAAGVDASTGDTIVIQDADLELDPSDMPAMLEKYYNEKYDLVTGTRFRIRHHHPPHALAAKIANIFFSIAASVLTGRQVTDINCGYKVLARSLFKELSLQEKRFGIETELMVKALRRRQLKFAECDVSYFPRKKTEGKKIRVKDGINILGKLFRYSLEGRPWISSLIIGFTITFMTLNMLSVKHWNDEQRVIEWDVISYYAYLPATFIYHDLSLGFVDGYDGRHKFIFWPEKGPEGKYVIKTTMGLSLLWLPFFGAGHLAAVISGADTGGFSPPYKFFLLVASLTFLLVGLIYTRRILLRFASDKVTALVLAAFAFGTNMYWYTLFQGTMAHVYSFALISAFVWYSIEWHMTGMQPALGSRQSLETEDRRLKTGESVREHRALSSVRLGLLLGLISLIRPTNIIIIVFFLLYGVISFKDFKNRMRELGEDYKYILLMIIMIMIIWLPQMIYWKEMTGHWLFFSYGSDERFFFGDPAIVKGLFSWRKGLFIYTPLLIFSFAGIFLLWIKRSPHALPVTVFVPLNIYIIFSWWCWWYGGGFGQRAFIDSYVLMAIAAAALLSDVMTSGSKLIKVSFISLWLLLMSLGIFNNIQYYHGAIHWDSMTREAYFDSFGRVRPSARFNSLLEAPDYDAARAGKDR